MVVSLFGVVNELGSEYGTFAFFIVIAGVVTIETVFHEVHTMTHDTSYQDMVSAIEKELMIVGIMAFTGKVIFMQVEFSDYEWVHAVEFAGRWCVCLYFSSYLLYLNAYNYSITGFYGV